MRNPIIIRNSQDIDNINILQTINARETIYTLGMKQKYLVALLNIAKKFRLKGKYSIKESPFYESDKGEISKLLWLSRYRIDYDLQLSFLKVSKKIPNWYLNQKIVRNPDIVDLHREYSQKVYDGELKASDWPEFLASKFPSIHN